MQEPSHTVVVCILLTLAQLKWNEGIVRGRKTETIIWSFGVDMFIVCFTFRLCQNNLNFICKSFDSKGLAP